jgi:hypothetical protein
VALSQDGAAEFPFIAEQYLLNTLGKVRTFLGLDIEYRDSTKQSNTALPPRWATYYLCRFELQNGVGTVSTGEVVKYHDAHGVVGPDTMLSLRLCDFLPRKNSDPIYPSVDISHQELANILNQADGVQNTRNNPVVASVSDDDEPPVVQRYSIDTPSALPPAPTMRPKTSLRMKTRPCRAPLMDRQ